jgi:hypothetical protein
MVCSFLRAQSAIGEPSQLHRHRPTQTKQTEWFIVNRNAETSLNKISPHDASKSIKNRKSRRTGGADALGDEEWAVGGKRR